VNVLLYLKLNNFKDFFSKYKVKQRKHLLLMEKNDQQDCAGEQHSNLELIKKIQAQISILEKNSN
jgi:hypothetical protein